MTIETILFVQKYFKIKGIYVIWCGKDIYFLSFIIFKRYYTDSSP